MPLSGHIDVLTRERIAGWAWDSERPSSAVSVVISIGEQLPLANVDDYYVELDRHDMFHAEGLPAESYFVAGNRADFRQRLRLP